MWRLETLKTGHNRTTEAPGGALVGQRTDSMRGNSHTRAIAANGDGNNGSFAPGLAIPLKFHQDRHGSAADFCRKAQRLFGSLK
jgi:hypothetical protein